MNTDAGHAALPGLIPQELRSRQAFVGLGSEEIKVLQALRPWMEVHVHEIIEEFYAHLLRRNLTFHGLAFAVGAEEAVFLVGALPLDAVTEPQLDRIIGSTWAYVERSFRPALRIGFASRFGGSP